MKRSFWITLIVSVTVGIVAVMAQAVRNKSLALRLAEEQARPAPADSRGQGAVNTPDESQSQTRLERALAKLGKLEPEDPEAKDRDRPARIFADFLRSVEGLNFDELVTASGETSDSTVQQWLLLLAAEQEPMRLYRSEKWKGVLLPDQMAEAVAVNEPAAASRILPPLKLRQPKEKVKWLYSEPELESHVRVAGRLLSSDLNSGLQAFLRIREVLDEAEVSSMPMGEFGPTLLRSLSEESIPGIIAAMRDPQYAKIRNDLRKRLVMDGQFKGGVARVAELMDAMELTPQELNYSVREMVNEDIMVSQPEAMLAWISEVEPVEIPRAVMKWVERDQQAATDWLVAQEPSPVRDQAIAKFATEASKLDLEAAVAWALEIQDEQLQEQTLRRVVNKK